MPECNICGFACSTPQQKPIWQLLKIQHHITQLNSVIPVLDATNNTFDNPQSQKSDNSLPFNSKEMLHFTSKYEPVQINIYQSNTYQNDPPRVQERHQAKDQQLQAATRSTSSDMTTIFHASPYGRFTEIHHVNHMSYYGV